MNFIERLWFRATTGTKIVDNTDVITTPYVIRFKDIFIEVDEMSDGEYSVGWFREPTVTHVPIREFWRAEPPKKRKPHATREN